MKPIKVLPPLRGEWNLFNTPGDQVPSHGTYEWGMAYAYDFARFKKVNNQSVWHNKSTCQYLLGQVTLSDTFSWGEPIYAPFDGVIRAVVSSIPERHRLHLVTDVGRTLYHSLLFSYQRGQPEQLSGNYIIIEGKECCAFIAHIQTGSIQHRVNETVKAGDYLANVGHSGNSTQPHLHFQLMDRVDITSAKGVLCCFSSYDIHVNDSWQKTECGVPSSQYTVRF